MNYHGGRIIKTFAGNPKDDPLEVIAFDRASLAPNPNAMYVDGGTAGYTQQALQMAICVGSVMDRANRSLVIIKGGDVSRVPPVPREQLARKISAQAGVYLLARSGSTSSGDGDVPRAYARANSLDIRRNGMLHIHELGIPNPDSNPRTGQYRARRAASAIMAALTDNMRPNAIVRVDGHREIPEIRSQEYFETIGMELGRRSPVWGAPGAFFVGKAGDILEAATEAYGLEGESERPMSLWS